jgi:hypothetical protein
LRSRNLVVTFTVNSGTEEQAMALEIKSTPILTGKSAKRFITIVEKNQDERISIAQRNVLTKLANTVLKKAKI